MVGGLMMAVYSGLPILINRRMLPGPIRVRGLRLGGLIRSMLLFGVAFVLTPVDQVGRANELSSAGNRAGSCRSPSPARLADQVGPVTVPRRGP